MQSKSRLLFPTLKGTGVENERTGEKKRRRKRRWPTDRPGSCVLYHSPQLQRIPLSSFPLLPTAFFMSPNEMRISPLLCPPSPFLGLLFREGEGGRKMMVEAEDPVGRRERGVDGKRRRSSWCTFSPKEAGFTTFDGNATKNQCSYICCVLLFSPYECLAISAHLRGLLATARCIHFKSGRG